MSTKNTFDPRDRDRDRVWNSFLSLAFLSQIGSISNITFWYFVDPTACWYSSSFHFQEIRRSPKWGRQLQELVFLETIKKCHKEDWRTEFVVIRIPKSLNPRSRIPKSQKLQTPKFGSLQSCMTNQSQISDCSFCKVSELVVSSFSNYVAAIYGPMLN